MESPRKKILYVITKSNFGGAQRYVYELATAMQAHYDVVVACGGDGPLVEKLTTGGIPVRIIKSFARDINIKKEFSALRELWKIYREEAPDIIHVNSSKAGGIGAFIARICRVPKIVFTAHGWPFFEDRTIVARSLIWLLSYITVLLSHRTIVVSEHDRIHACMPFIGHKITKIHTAVPAINFLDRHTARERLLPEDLRTQHVHDWWAVSTGELTSNKNLNMLLEAVCTYNATYEKKVFLTLISEGEDRVMLEKYAKDHNMGTYVYFAGYVDDARSYLKAFDIFLLPSKKEGMPYGLLEAGVAQLGCIASRVGGIPEIIASPACGILIDPLDCNTVVTALVQYAQKPETISLHGKNLSERIQNEFNIQNMLAETHMLYESTNSRAT